MARKNLSQIKKNEEPLAKKTRKNLSQRKQEEPLAKKKGRTFRKENKGQEPLAKKTRKELSQRKQSISQFSYKQSLHLLVPGCLGRTGEGHHLIPSCQG
jgi:hypothetical protein